jgi:hypothetical protein
VATTLHDADRPARRGLFSGRPLTAGERGFVACAVGFGAGMTAWLSMHTVPEMAAKDFTYPWRAARALLAGQNPYDVIVPSGTYPFESYLPYPLPAAVVTLPFALVPAQVGAAIFTGVTSALLAWLLIREGTWRLWAFLGAPFAMTLVLAQWGPLLMAGALLPLLGFVLAIKPTIGLALFAYRPRWEAVVGGLLICAVAFAFLPTWPVDWWEATRSLSSPHPAPIMRPFGWIGLLSLLCWRRPEARLLAAMTCVPQNLYFYDQLPLMLVAWNARTAAALVVLSWLGWAVTKMRCADPYFCGTAAEQSVIWLVYLPATLLVLWRGREDIPLVGARWSDRQPGREPAPEMVA